MDSIGTLRELGYRITPQRAMILTAIQGSESHISAEEIYAQIQAKYPSVDISTVYRTLELLKELGMVTETRLADGLLRYHYADKGKHHHLVCRKCGAIFDLDESSLGPLKNELLRQYNFKADIHHLAIFGHCTNCK